MNFDFSEDQKLIQSEAKKFLRQCCNNELVRKIMEDDDLHYDSSLWQKIVQLGWPGLAISERYQGHGLGYLEMCVLAQELGRSLAPLPFSSTVYLFAEAIKLAGTDDQKESLLTRVAKGDLIGCIASVEKMGQSITQTPTCKVSDGYINGEKIAVLDASSANYAIVSALDEPKDQPKSQPNAVSLFIVGLDSSGVTKTAVDSLDPSRPQATLKFENAEASLLGSSGDGITLLKRVYDQAAVLFAFEQVGGCEAALKMGINYTKQRFAFGRPVASFQAIKHKFADMYVAKEIALANAYYGAWALATDAPELALAAATARVSAINAYFLCSKENLQAHGGMGYTWQLDCHLHYRRAQHLSLAIGGLNEWKQQITQELLAQQDTTTEVLI